MGNNNSNIKNSVIVGQNGKAWKIRLKFIEKNKQKIRHYAAACGAGFIGGIIASIIANLITG